MGFRLPLGIAVSLAATGIVALIALTGPISSAAKTLSGIHAIAAGYCQAGTATVCDVFADDLSRLVMLSSSGGVQLVDGGFFLFGQLPDSGYGIQPSTPLDAGPGLVDAGGVAIDGGP